MSGCCSLQGHPQKLQMEQPGQCPECGRKAKSVSTLTVKSLVRDHFRVSAKASYWFCKVLECEAVYSGQEGVFHKSDLKVRVGIKEREDPVPLCYCFDYSPE